MDVKTIEKVMVEEVVEGKVVIELDIVEAAAFNRLLAKLSTNLVYETIGEAESDTTKRIADKVVMGLYCKLDNLNL